MGVFLYVLVWIVPPCFLMRPLRLSLGCGLSGVSLIDVLIESVKAFKSSRSVSVCTSRVVRLYRFSIICLRSAVLAVGTQRCSASPIWQRWLIRSANIPRSRLLLFVVAQRRVSHFHDYVDALFLCRSMIVSCMGIPCLASKSIRYDRIAFKYSVRPVK